MNKYIDVDNKKFDTAKINGIIIILDQMSGDDKASLLSALYNDSIKCTDICSILKNNGWEVSYDQVRRFRNGSCKIPDRYKRLES